MKKQLLSPSILLLFALSVLSVNMLWVSAAAYPAIMVVPESTVTKDLTVGMLYTVSIYTDYTGKDIIAYQFTLSYNPSVLNGFEVTNGKLIVGIAQFIPGKFDNTAGKLSLTGATFLMPGMPGQVASGPGTLANVTFRVVGIGTSEITIGPETKLIGWNATAGKEYYIIDAATMPTHIQHGSFDNTGADAYPPYPPMAVITGEEDVYAKESVTFSGASSYDPDRTAITNYRWNFGDGTPLVETTDPAVNHTYKVIGTYEVTLFVTDEQKQVSDPAYFSTSVTQRPQWAAELIGKKAWPEHNRHDISKHGVINTLYAQVQNIGVQTVMVKVKFAIHSARAGELLGTIETNEVQLTSLQMTVLTADFDTNSWGTGKFYVKAQCFYFDGITWAAGVKIKAFSFAVVL